MDRGDDFPRRSMVGAPPTAHIKSSFSLSKVKMEKKEVPPPNLNMEESESEEELDETTQDTQDTEEADKNAQPEKKRRKRRRKLLTDPVKAKKRAERTRERKEAKEEEPGEQDHSAKEKEKEPEVEEPPKFIQPSLRKYTPFQLLCDNIMRKLMSKDPEEFFAHPVSEKDAPDYHTIISNPMDFFTIRQKIEADEYQNIEQFRHDVALITENAMAYNQPNTIYHAAAQKMSVVAKYYLSEQYLTYLRHSLPFGRDIPYETMGVRPKQAHPRPVPKKSGKVVSALAAIADNVTTRDVLKTADKRHKDALADRVPNWHLGYLDNKNGALTLNIVTKEDKPSIQVGDLLNKLDKGTPGLYTPYEPRFPAEMPISYTNYGPFSSFAPQYDSTWATMSKRDSDLLVACYGDKQNVADAMALRQSVANSSENLIRVVDGLLDTLTDGEHSRTLKALETPEKEAKAEAAARARKQPLSGKELTSLLDSVSTLENIGLDVSFLNDLKVDMGLAPRPPTVDDKLRKTGAMVKDLAHLQNARLGGQMSATLTDAPRPTAQEAQLGAKVAQELTAGISQLGAPPAEFVNARALHEAIGMNDDDCDYDLLNEFFVDPSAS